MSTRERLRASDRDREAVAERLRDAATEGRLGPDELDERLSAAFTATTYGELDTLTDDLPLPAPAPPPEIRARAGFGRRAGAWLIDGIVVSLVAGILSAVLHHGAARSGLTVLVSVLYFTLLEGSAAGGGAGKQAMGIRVVDAHTSQPIGYGRAFVRWLGRILSFMVFLLGYFWMLWDEDKQCWHDKFANDVVVFSDGRTEYQQLNRRY